MTDIKKAEVWEDGMRTDPTHKSFEWWYIDANFSDGTTIVLTFYTKSPSKPNGSLTPQLEVTVNKPDGKKLYYSHYYSKSEFSAATDKCEVKMGPNTLSGNLKTYAIHIEIPEFMGDFEIERIAPSYSTSMSRYPDKPEYFGWFCAVPYGKVSVKAQYEGKEHLLTGFGYHDHNWGIIDIKQVCDYWYWGRGNAGDYSLIYSVMFLPKILGGKQASVLYMAKGDKILLEDSNNLKVSHVDINPPTPKPGHLPKSLNLSYSGETYDIDISLAKPVLIDTKDPIAGEPGWKKAITRLFSKPLYVRYNANLDLVIKEKGKVTQKSGTGLYEIMMLH